MAAAQGPARISGRIRSGPAPARSNGEITITGLSTGGSRPEWGTDVFHAGYGRAALVSGLLLFAPSLGAVELSGYLALEARGFAQSPAHPLQIRNGFSFAAQPEIYHAFGDGRQSLLFTPFLRADMADGRRTHFDVRELLYQGVFDSAELRIGIGRVFWGVTESRHLVDRRQPDGSRGECRSRGEARPAARQTSRSFGIGARSISSCCRGFASGRFRGGGGACAPNPSSIRPGHLRIRRGSAPHRLRGSVVPCVGGLRRRRSALSWNERDPHLLPVSAAAVQGSASHPGHEAASSEAAMPALAEGPVLAPHYGVVHRTSLDLQATGGAWLWKLEALHESGRESAWVAWVAGFEYTRFGINESAADLGLLVEHLFDGRGGSSPQPFENDVFAGPAPRVQRRSRRQGVGRDDPRRRRRRDGLQPRSVAAYRRALDNRIRSTGVGRNRSR